MSNNNWTRHLRFNVGQTCLTAGVVAISVTLLIFLGALIEGLQRRLINSVTGAIAHVVVRPPDRLPVAAWQVPALETPGVLYVGRGSSWSRRSGRSRTGPSGCRGWNGSTPTSGRCRRWWRGEGPVSRYEASGGDAGGGDPRGAQPGGRSRVETGGGSVLRPEGGRGGAGKQTGGGFRVADGR